MTSPSFPLTFRLTSARQSYAGNCVGAGRALLRAVRGFMLVELLVTVTIVAVLASIALPLAELAVRRQKEQALHAALRQIRSAIDTYKLAGDQGAIRKRADQSGYPDSLDALEGGVDDARSPERAKMYFLRRLPRDPLYPDAQAPAADTWGKRSYASPPDAPREGTDVYDVYSLAPGAGLNGVPYNEW
ncbi:type II secretion system protein [Massilia glaciei]|uniref:General secretion pathway protein GspG n=1 Tax=Massilia glaciei TaxID=1524097 RepID=A0A2U2HC54_9BURK|nr:type II secretion system protein [Massilia glaciei]PWF40455.1 general secretion pathway protein GspG [Massilia glaciei]